MNVNVKVGIACTLGGFVGTLVALQMNPFFWWVGMVAGAAVAYLGYEFRQVVSAAGTAYRNTISWSPDLEWWGLYSRRVLRTLYLFINIMIGAGLVILPISYVLLPERMQEMRITLWLVFVGGIVVATILGGLVGADMSTHDLRRATLWEEKMLPFKNPLDLWMGIMPVAASIFIWWVLKQTPAVFEATLRAVCWFFRIVHDDIRLLCAVDAALGAAVGYFAGSALVGAGAGGLIGVVHYVAAHPKSRATRW